MSASDARRRRREMADNAALFKTGAYEFALWQNDEHELLTPHLGAFDATMTGETANTLLEGDKLRPEAQAEYIRGWDHARNEYLKTKGRGHD